MYTGTIHPDDVAFSPRPKAAQHPSSSATSAMADSFSTAAEHGQQTPAGSVRPSQPLISHLDAVARDDDHDDDIQVTAERPARRRAARTGVDSSSFLTPFSRSSSNGYAHSSSSMSSDEDSTDAYREATDVDDADDLAEILVDDSDDEWESGRRKGKGGRGGKTSGKLTTPRKHTRPKPYTPSSSRTPTKPGIKATSTSTPRRRANASAGPSGWGGSSGSGGTPSKGSAYSGEEDWLLFQALYARISGPQLAGVSAATGRDLVSLKNRSMAIHRGLEDAIKRLGGR